MRHLLTPYTFGCMSLGRDPVSPAADVALVREAMEQGVSFHGSRTYNNGFSFMILRMAFDADRPHLPAMIHKVRDGSVPLMRFETEDICLRLGLDHLDIAQLTSMDARPGNLIDQLRGDGGPLVDELASLKDRGRLHHAVLFLNPHNGPAGVQAAEHDLIDGVTFYWNPLQCDCGREALNEIRKRNIPVLALRTLGGWRDKQLAHKRKHLEERLPDHDPVQLALDFAASQPQALTTIGGTASPEHFRRFIEATEKATPLPPGTLEQIEHLQFTPTS